ncbi:MAG: hypothetical protein V1893_03345 [Candidatus Omnitrophota bacterium]
MRIKQFLILIFMTVVICSFFVYQRNSIAETKNIKYTPPFEYEARPLLEKHTQEIEALKKDVAALQKQVAEALFVVNKLDPYGDLRRKR